MTMSLEQTLRDVRRRLQSGRLPNEPQVKKDVIEVVLRALGWQGPDLAMEFRTRLGPVDYALLDQGRRPGVFIEAKQLDYISSGSEEQLLKYEEQLFKYAEGQPVPLLVLTDGRNWFFYLNMRSPPEELRYFQLDLAAEGDVPDNAAFLQRQLARDRLGSRETIAEAHELLRRGQDRRRARSVIPRVWRDMVNQPDEALCQMLSDAVKRDIGVRPDKGDVRDFLSRGADRSTDSTSPPRKGATASANASTPPDEEGVSRRRARGRRPKKTERTQRARVEEGKLLVEYEDGPSSSWDLPNQSDRENIRRVREAVAAFGRENKATEGQIAAAWKTLTNAGYKLR